jgi:hypothetical protein
MQNRDRRDEDAAYRWGFRYCYKRAPSPDELEAYKHALHIERLRSFPRHWLSEQDVADLRAARDDKNRQSHNETIEGRWRLPDSRDDGVVPEPPAETAAKPSKEEPPRYSGTGTGAQATQGGSATGTRPIEHAWLD